MDTLLSLLAALCAVAAGAYTAWTLVSSGRK
jgi:hypothetical protein